MKELQSSFTTLEQSNRLLEMGVPADSADCFYRDWDCLLEHPSVDTSRYVHVRNTLIEREAPYTRFAGNTPCWSVGRLMEIYELCTPYSVRDFDFTGTYVEQLCKAFLFAKETNKLDFSKLKE